MKPIELRSEMRVKSRYRLGLFLIIAPWLLIGLGYWLGSPTVSSELNRQEAFNIAVEISNKCDTLFIPAGKGEKITIQFIEKCRQLHDLVMELTYRAKSEKIKFR